ncbi:M3 family metallopeptidase [Shewanella sp. 0m-4]
MQKYISVPTAKHVKWLFSPLFIVICWFNTAAHAAVSPIPILVEQCLSYNFPAQQSSTHSDKTSVPQYDSNTQAIELERDFIGFFNINDRIKYYRQFPLSYTDRELLLQCQLYLADELALYFQSTQFQSTRFKLADSHDPAIQALVMRINRLAKNTERPKYKAQLHTAQAAFKQGISSQSLSLNFFNNDCKLASVEPATDFNGSLANYLIQQPSEQCRKRVWQAYQARASHKNYSSLNLITELRQHQAELDGFSDYSHEVLHQQWLSTPELVKQFLQTQTQAINIAPWDLGLTLSKATPTPVNTMASMQLLQLLADALQTFSITMTAVNEKLYRVWLDGRLLGDIYLTEGNKTRVKPIRQLVVGQQFGQFELIVKPELKTYQQQSAVIESVASIITQLASGQKFYLPNTIGETQDTAQIDTLWLQQYLKSQLLPELKQDSRESVLLQYAQQLHIFRAKVAINTYLAANSPLKFDLNQAFTQAFAAQWDQVDDAAYTFSALVFEGPLYYQKIWQKAVANYIYHSTKDCQNQKLVFDYLVVNESANDIASIFEQLLGEPVTNDSLIKRTQHAFNPQDQHPRRCTILRQ